MIEAGVAVSLSELDEIFPERASLPAPRKDEFDLTQLMPLLEPPAIHDALLPLLKNKRPDLIVRDQFAFGGYLIGEKYNIPHATINITAGWPRSKEFLNSILATPLNELRAEYALPDDPELNTLFPYLRLDTAPPTLLPKGISTISTARSFNQFATKKIVANETSLPSWVTELPHDKTVLVTLGTLWNQSNELYNLIIHAIQDEAVNVIVATGRNTEQAMTGNFPANVRVAEYIPFTALLPHLDAVVFHAGFISLLTMLWAAIPMVAIPVGADQFGNAEAIEMAGIGIGIKPDERSSINIRNALMSVLNQSSYREAAKRVQADMSTQLSVAEACDLLEQVARTGKPV